jgi:hypothetical protein
MNKRQKLVQQQFLDNEEAVIRRLKAVYNQSLKDIEQKIQILQQQINNLQAQYDAIDDEKERARLMSMQQSKIYQKQYQDALKKQISSILDNMQVAEFETVADYLNKCYEEGFLGTVYDLHGQGVPVMFPIDQEAVVRAVQLDSKISKGLYQRLGEDVDLLKRKITAQVSRGISTGMSFDQVAQQLASYTNIGFNNAVRIARTEGHRIQVQSGMDACYKAKEKGADVVKQWDSTLDGSTRESHQQVDGEIRELDEKFSNGLMFPGDPSGGAAEVVNCRCALLQRARWALDEQELATLKERAAYYGLDKEDNFKDFKKKYLNTTQQMEKQMKIEFPDDVYKINGFTKDIKKEVDTALQKLNNEYDIKLNSIVVESVGKGDIFVTGYHDGVVDMVVNKDADFKKIMRRIPQRYETGQFAGKSIEDYLAHEMAHCMLYQDCTSDAMYRSKYKQIETLYDSLKGVSGYADRTKSGNEALAEAFVRVRNNEPVSPIVKVLVNTYFGKWKK